MHASIKYPYKKLMQCRCSQRSVSKHAAQVFTAQDKGRWQLCAPKDFQPTMERTGWVHPAANAPFNPSSAGLGLDSLQNARKLQKKGRLGL